MWIEDEDWKCDCSSREDPCQHVLAAAIFLHNQGCADSNDKPVPKLAHIEYNFFRKNNYLSLVRNIAYKNKKTPFTHSLRFQHNKIKIIV